MKKAYILMLHHLPEQANLLIEQLIADDSDVYVHIDKKTEEFIKSKIKVDRHIIYIKENISISWGGNGLLKATLNSYRQILKSGKIYDYVIMVTGQDLLIKNGIDEFLEANDKTAYIDCDNSRPDYFNRFKKSMLLHYWPEKYLRRIDFKLNPLKIKRAIRVRLFMLFPNLKKKTIQFDISKIQFYYDKVWHAFPIEIVRYIIDFIDNNPTFWDIYENSFMADEGFFTTVIMNSPFKDKIKFVDGFSKSITFNKKAVNNHPPILTMDDIKDIDVAKDCFFARKFDSRVDEAVIDYYVCKAKRKRCEITRRDSGNECSFPINR